MTAETTQPLLLSPAQASKVIAVSPRKLWSMTAGGEIPHLKIGRLVRYSCGDLERWVLEQRRHGRDTQPANAS